MNKKKNSFEDAAKEIDVGLGGLFGALNDALGEMMARLDEGGSGTVSRDHTFTTEKGPVRAQAGIRVRMGGMEATDAASSPKPVNPDRTRPKPSTRNLSYDIMTDGDAWILTADVPGVSRKDIQLARDKTVLHITTDGDRKYAAAVDMEGNFDLDAIKITMRNGILILRIPQEDSA